MDDFVPWSTAEEYSSQPLNEYLARRFPQCFLSKGSPSELNVYLGHQVRHQAEVSPDNTALPLHSEHDSPLDVKRDLSAAASSKWLKLSSVAQLEEQAKVGSFSSASPIGTD